MKYYSLLLAALFLSGLPSQASTPTAKDCCRSLKKFQELNHRVQEETLLEALSLLAMMTKQNIKNRIIQIPQSVLEQSVDQLERTYAKMQMAHENEADNSLVKKSVNDETLNRMKYLINKIKETLKEYERGDRGARGHLGHAGTSQKARKRKAAAGRRPTPPTVKREKTETHSMEDEGFSENLGPSILEICEEKALQTCAQEQEKTGIAFVTASIIVENGTHGAILNNFTEEHAGKNYLVHPNQSPGLSPGDIICVKKITKKEYDGMPYVQIVPTQATCLE